MNTTSSSSSSAALDKLKHDWPNLHDLDRAEAVAKINGSGISNRQIAEELGTSESLLRHLKTALQAPAAEAAAARRGELSTNQLVRRAKDREARLAARRDEDLKRKHSEQVLHGVKLICDWLKQTDLAGPSCEMIVREASILIDSAEYAGTLLRLNVRPGVSAAQVIEVCRPKPFDGEIDIIAWYGTWLAGWAPIVFPDPIVRRTALDEAEKVQERR